MAMKKFAVKLCYTTYLYEEVEAENELDAIEEARNKVDAYDDDEYKKKIVDNLSWDESQTWEI
jgi:hypothetical protein